ncbi:hypothetical protein FZ103_11635 [Streptomonospora sp. PA3]|uniref:hypothetical protein n=1 Tax=Streptomonospora sp. PA3 TaxID=2607326 RepID=UPI0012DBE080|nr:hypothetical protein [Streptomonospora sp. PA3]MUL41818.1 hypothetical protein [Streptomonospora sp. PA3]
MARVLRRAGVLTGLAAAGWLLGQAPAAADELPGPGLAPVAEVASEAGADIAEAGIGRSDLAATGDGAADAGDAATGGTTAQEVGRIAKTAPESAAGALADAAEPGRAAAETGLPALAPAAESRGVTEAAEAAGAGARGVVRTTAQGTGEVLTDTVRAGREAGREVGGFADASLGDSRLAGAVSDGLADDAGRLQDHLEQTIQEGPQAGLDGVAATLVPPRPDERIEDPVRPEAADSTKQESAAAKAAGSARSAPQAPVQALAAAAAEAAQAGSAHSSGSADAAEPLNGSAWHDASDSTGAVSSSPVPGAPAGFLMSRSHTLRLVAQRVALPDSPAVVVRYTADDPSFSPD